MIVINASEFKDKKSVYDIFNAAISFEYEVGNLDQLFDQLSLTDHEIKIINYRYIFTNLGDYGQRLINVFLDLVRLYDIKISLIY